MGKITRSHTPNKPVLEFVDNNFALDRKIKEALAGLKPSFQWLLMELPRDEDKELIADFIVAWSNDSIDGHPMATNTKAAYIDALVRLARYHGHKKSFKEMTRDDIFAYLNSMKKDFSQDIQQKWVNTYNARGAKYLGFWKWLTQPDLKKEERQTPLQLKGFRAAKRKSKTSRKREDMWTPEEHRVFLQYCEDLRLACYHAIAMETGARPGELLALKISDLKIRTSPSTGRKYAEFTIGDKIGGKMKKPRPVSISDAIPHYNAWVSVHPLRDRPKDAYLFPSMQNKSKYRNRPLEENSLRIAFDNIIEKQFPKLLDRPDVSLEDKAALKSIIYDKPHFPYMRRHEFYSEWAPRLPPQAFNQLVGHSKNSRMYEVYLHELGSEGNRELLIQKGIINRDETISLSQKAIQPKFCPICHEANKQEAKFCFKCNFIISKEGWLEDKEREAEVQREAEETKKKMQELEAKQEILQANAASVFRALMAAEAGVIKPQQVEIITWNADKGSEGLFEAADIARAENEKRERQHKEYHKTGRQVHEGK